MSEKKKKKFEEQVSIYEDDVYRIIVSVIGNHHTAQDLSQTVMERAWKGFHQLRSPKRSKKWVKAITRNTLREYMRKKKSYLSHVDVQFIADIEKSGELKAIEADILDAIIRKEDKERVNTAMSTLHPTLQKIIREHLLGEIKLKEVAKYHAMNYGTVRSYYSKGMKLLKDAYAKLEKGEKRNG